MPQRMQDASALPGKLRFDVYEVDARAGELRKHGYRIRLEDRPFRALLILLQHANEVVTREELQKQLWPSDVFVDFDNGLNTAIGKVRRALNDSAEKPRFIETVGRRGYRFVAAVETMAVQVISPEIATQAKAGAKEDGVLGQEVPSTTPRTPASKVEEKTGLGPIRGLRWKIASLIAAFALLALGWRAAPGWRERITGNRGRIPLHSVAVLPFENLSGDTAQDYVADGIADFLTTDLAKVHQLRVISRTSASRYRRTNKTVPEIARELGVDAIVEGSFLRSENRVRVTAQLIDARADRHLWANNYERQASDLFALQSELGHAVAREVAVQLSPAEEASFATGHTVNPDAWDSYVKGKFFFSKRTRAGFQQSCQCFEESIAHDPAFAPAYAGLSECTHQLGIFGALPLQQSILKAKATALKAVELDANSSEAHAALAAVLLYAEWNWGEAQREISRALELDPNSATAHVIYVRYLWAMGKKEETVAEARKVKELDPLNPASPTALGWYYVWTSQEDLGEREFREALDLDPNTILAHIGLAEIYARRKQYDQAAAERFAGFSHSSSDPPAIATEFLKIYKERGYPAADRFILEYYLKQSQEEARLGLPSACDLGVSYAELGDKKNALLWMEKGLDEHCRAMMDLKSRPQFDFLRNEPRFHALLQRMKLEPSR